MPKKISLLLCLLLPCASTWADTFSTAFCDFSVNFPGKYSIREMLSEDSAGVAAVANATSDTRIAAECWPYIEKPPLDVYANAMQAEMKQRGFIINNVSIDQHSGVAPQVIISGRLKAGGETYHTTSISFMGQRSRLDLSIVERHIASKEHMAFRSSVRLK